jgi:uncharacterized membrane protein
MRTISLAIAAVILVSLGLTFWWYPMLPDPMVSHWNAAGQADGAMPKYIVAWLVPALMVLFSAIFAVVPRVDPLKQNYRNFREYYNGFVLIFIIVFFVIQLQVLLWNLGTRVSPNLTFPVILGIFFIYIGVLLRHAEPNWFVGIRTPWTLSSPAVWKETHARRGLLFIIAGVIALCGVLVPAYAFAIILVPVIAVAVYTVVYSFVLWRRETAAALV